MSGYCKLLSLSLSLPQEFPVILFSTLMAMGSPQLLQIYLSLPTFAEKQTKLDTNSLSFCRTWKVFLPARHTSHAVPTHWFLPSVSPSFCGFFSLRCSTDLGTDRRAGVFCSGTVSHCLLLSGLPNQHYSYHSHGNNTSPQRPPHGRAPSHVCSSHVPPHQPGGGSPFHRARARERPSHRQKRNLPFVQPECFVLRTVSPQGENIPGFQRQLLRVDRALPKDDPALSLPYPEEPFHRPPVSVPDHSIQ